MKSKLERLQEIKESLSDWRKEILEAYLVGAASVHIDDKIWDSLLESAKVFAESKPAVRP